MKPTIVLAVLLGLLLAAPARATSWPDLTRLADPFVGTMSAWWVLGALGFYPAVPGAGVLALNSPLFREAELRIAGGPVRISAPAAARGRPYVRGLALDGRALDRPWLRWGEVARGATLRFSLSGTPGSRWGTDARAAPPSYGVR